MSCIIQRCRTKGRMTWQKEAGITKRWWKQIGKIVVKRNTQNTITKTHTHTNLKAADFGFRTKKKG